MTDVKQLEEKSTDNAGIDEIMNEILRCAISWQPEARIIGNIRACDIARAARAHLQALKQEPYGYTVELRYKGHLMRQSRVVRFKSDADNTAGNFKRSYDSATWECDTVTVPLYKAPVPQEATPDDLHIAYQQGRADERESLKGKCIPPFPKTVRPVYPLSEDGE